MRCIGRRSLTLALLLLLHLMSSAKATDLAPLRALVNEGSAVSALVLRLRDGAVLASLDPEQPLIPASVSKLLVAATVLDVWGAAHIFTTRLLSSAPRNGAILNGDLLIEGAGDPMLVNEKLWFLCTDIARQGIREIAGDLVLHSGRFATMTEHGDRATAAQASAHAYDGALSAVAVNYSVLAAVISPGETPGAPAQAGLEPYPLDTVSVINQITTGPNASAPTLSVLRERTATGDRLTVSGSIARDSPPLRVYRSVSDPDAYAGAVFKAFLQQAGVRLRGQIRISRAPLPPEARTLARVDSYPLAWQVRNMLHASNNFIADMLTIQLDPAAATGRNATLAGGAQRLATYLAATGAASTRVIVSGSGLDPANRLAAQDVVRLLAHVQRQSAQFPDLLAALPVAGREGPLRERFTTPAAMPLQGRLRAKSGTLSAPVHAVGLAGYSPLPDGDWAAFAVLVNGTDRQPAPGLARARHAIDAALTEVLATPARPR